LPVSDGNAEASILSLFDIALTLAPRPKRRPFSWAAFFRHLGGFGLFLVAVLDSSPIPTFGGPDILTAIFCARHAEPWYYYSVMATLGSVLGAWLTYRAAHLAGASYLQSKFGKRRVKRLLQYFERWGTGSLAISAAVPFPFPTSAFFAAAGVLNYSRRKFIAVVALCRGLRYALIGLIAFLYGRQFLRVMRHPKQYYGWFLAIVFAIAALVATGIMIQRRLQPEE